MFDETTICARPRFPRFAWPFQRRWPNRPDACAVMPEPHDRGARRDQRPSALELDGELFYQLLIGEMNARAGEPAAGFALILDAARKTNDPQLYQRAADIALQSRSGDAALQAAQAWRQALPTSREANRYVLQILIALNRITETVEPLRTELMAPLPEQASHRHVAAPLARAADKSWPGCSRAGWLNNCLSGYRRCSGTAVGSMRLAAGELPGAWPPSSARSAELQPKRLPCWHLS